MVADQEVLLQWRYDPQATPGLLGWFDGVEEAIGRTLEATANGRRGAGMFGGGTVQVQCVVVDPDRAVRDLLAALGRFGPRVGRPVVAVRDGRGHRVVFPPDHRRPFASMWGQSPAEPGAAADGGA